MLRLLLNAELWPKLLAILLHNHLYNKQDLLYDCRRHTVPQWYRFIRELEQGL